MVAARALEYAGLHERGNLRGRRWSQDFHALLATRGNPPRRGRHRSRLQFPQRLLRMGGRATRGSQSGRPRDRLAGPREIGGRALLRREVRRLRRRRGALRTNRQTARAGLARLSARSQRGRRHLLHLHHRASVRDRGFHLRKLRLPGPRARHCALHPQGAEPRGAARPRPQAEERGLFTRPQDRRHDEQGPADCQRGAAHPDRRRDGAGRRAAEEGVFQDSSAGSHPPRLGRQGHQAERQPPLRRVGRLDRSDVQDLRRLVPRPTQRSRSADRDERHLALARRAYCESMTQGGGGTMFTQLRGCWALAVLAACGGSTITGVTGGAPPDNTTDGDRDAGTGGNGITAGDAGAESASDAPSMLGPCDGECTLSFASGADWRAYDDDPASNAGAIFLGSAQPVCLNASAPPNCPANAFNYGLAGSAWGVSLSMIPGALWIWGPNITLYY